nr:hypothetical protein B0A51_03787 [Rachicladosporium sp. CCFEE 5018]
MHFTTKTISAIIALATSTQALSHQAVLNNCNGTLYLTYVNSTKSTTGPSPLLAFANTELPIIGVGNSLGVSKSDQYWSPQTPKLILGTSTDNGILYWSVSYVDGDPFAGQKVAVTSAGRVNDVCQNSTGYDGKVHACQDDGVVLSLGLC